jgi:hypothetical protein
MRTETATNNSQIVQAKINGRRVSLMVDTGCTQTILTTACARQLRLEVLDTGKSGYAVGGVIRGHLGIAQISSFTLNNFEINRLSTILVLPRTDHWDQTEGLLGFDYLHLNAVILPVGATAFLFKPGPHPPVPLEHYLSVLGYQGVPLHYVEGGLRIEGELNGLPLTAEVDSGCAYSAFDFDFVTKAGTNVVSTPFRPEDVAGHQGQSYGFTPRQLSFGPMDFRSGKLLCYRAPVFAKAKINALLGYDLLGTHRAILDFGHDILWMK